MFRRKKPDSATSAPSFADGTPPMSSASSPAAPGTSPFPAPASPSFPPVSKAGSVMQAKSPSTPASARPETPRRLTEVSTPVNSGDGKKLTVGRDIALSGSINSCERLIVEGSVEADLTDAIALEVAEGGTFRGTAEVDEADIAGTLEGTLIARKKLSIRATGLIKGTVRYARMSVDVGGKIDGTIEPLPSDGTEVPVRSPLIPNYRPEQG